MVYFDFDGTSSSVTPEYSISTQKVSGTGNNQELTTEKEVVYDGYNNVILREGDSDSQFNFSKEQTYCISPRYLC